MKPPPCFRDSFLQDRAYRPDSSSRLRAEPADNPVRIARCDRVCFNIPCLDWRMTMNSAVATSRNEERKQGKAIREKDPRTALAEWKPRP